MAVPDEASMTEEARQQVAATDLDATRVSLVVLATLAVFYTLSVASGIILPLLFALVFNLLLLPGKRLLVDRARLPASLAAILLILALLAVVGGVLTAISIPASNWIAKIPEGLPALQQRLGFMGRFVDLARHGADRLQAVIQPRDGAGAVTVQQGSPIGSMGIAVLQGTRAALSQLLVLIVVLFFSLTAGDMLLRRTVEILPSFADKRRLVEIAVEIERNVSAYLVTITAMNALVGVANGVSMWALGLPDPLLWGTLAFLLNYIPIVGPVTGVAVFFSVGLISGPTLWQAVLPAGIYLAIHVAEGETVTPLLLARRFTLNPVLVIVSLFFWDWMWGIAGAFLAVPLLAIAKIVCDRVAPLTPLGHLLGAPKESGISA